MPEPVTTRSGRRVKNPAQKQSHMDALEILARQRRGEKIDTLIREEEPLFDEVNEDEYKRTRKGRFVVVGEDDEEIEDDSDLDFIDDEEDEVDRKSKSKQRKSKSKWGNHELEPHQPSVKSFFGKPTGQSKKHATSGGGSSIKTPIIGKDAPKVDEDDILSQMLFTVADDPMSSIQKRPTRVGEDRTRANLLSQQSSSRPIKTKAEYEPINVKRPRKFSPDFKSDFTATNNDDIFSNNDISYADLPQDNCFDDSLSLSELPTLPKDTSMKTEQSFDIVTSQDDFETSDEFAKNDLDIVSVPLNDDLESNLDFFEQDDGTKYTRMYWYDCVEEPVKTPGTVYFFGRIMVTAKDGKKRYMSCCTVVKDVRKTCYLLIKPDCSYEQAVFEFTNMIAKPLKFRNFSCQKVTKKYAFSADMSVPLEADYVQVDYAPNQAPLPASLSGETFSKVFNLNQSPMEKMILDLKLRGPCWLRLINPSAPGCSLTWTKIELILDKPDKLLVEPENGKLEIPYFCTFSLSLRTFPNPITHNNEIIAIAGMVNKSFNLDKCLNRTNKAESHFLLMTRPPDGHKELRWPLNFENSIKNYHKICHDNKQRGELKNLKFLSKFKIFRSERDLLEQFMNEYFHELDPDIVVGHDLLNFDYETLVMRMKANNLGIWSILGRFKRSELPQTKAAFRYMFSGRVLCDIKTSAQELIKARSYDLTQLTLQILGYTRRDYEHDSIVEAYKSPMTLIELIRSTWQDNDNIFSILAELNIIPLALKITNITGNILSRTLAAGRSERNEYLLLHAFHEANYICPEKQLSSGHNNRFANKRLAANNNNGKNNNNNNLQASKSITNGTTDNNNPDSNSNEQQQQQDKTSASNPLRKKAAYAGGLVLEPKAGYYDTCILLMDFNSLYPSIIQEFNICFSTVRAPDLTELAECPEAEIIAKVPAEGVATGILPAQLKELVQRRRAVKKLMADLNVKDTNQKLMLDIEQKALKLTANSMYGCLGFDQSRFYAKHLASLVTFKGREILMSTKSMVEKLGFEVIYGDTDSLMINTKITQFDEVLQRGLTIKTEINSKFNLLEIDIDGVYRPLLLLKKKNYAGALIKKLPDGTFQRDIETKGLDTVRRDRAVIAKEAGEKVLAMLLDNTTTSDEITSREIDSIVYDIHQYLKQLGASVLAGELEPEKFLITKQLNRNPDEYRDTKGLGHVVLAKRHNSTPGVTRKLKAGDTVEYVICLDGSQESANQRAYTLQELANNNQTLKLDFEYYLCQQIHPVMVRICDKLPTTNAYVLAEMLGVEKSQLLHIRRDDCDADTNKKDLLLSRGAARFNSCPPIQITCPNCNFEQSISTKSRKNLKTKELEFCLTSCPECGIRYALRSNQIVAQFIQLIRKLTICLYTTCFVCNNAECSHKTRNLLSPLGQIRGQERPICELCDTLMAPEWDDRRLDLQLNFMRFLMNIERAQLERDELNIKMPSEDVLSMYRHCLAQIDYALSTSFINNIDTNTIFSLICSSSSGANSSNATSNSLNHNGKPLSIKSAS